MESTDDATFLRDLVKTSRQKIYDVAWTDRDGTKRHTMLNAAENARLNAMAHGAKTSKAEVLRQAAFVPVAKSPPPASES